MAAVSTKMAPKTTTAPTTSNGPNTSPKMAKDNKAVVGIKPAFTTLQMNPAIPTPQDSNSAHANTRLNRKRVVKPPVNVAARTARRGRGRGGEELEVMEEKRSES